MRRIRVNKNWLVAARMWGSNVPIAIISASSKKSANELFWATITDDELESYQMDRSDDVDVTKLDLSLPMTLIGALS